MRRWVRLSVSFEVAGDAIDDHAFDVLDQLHELKAIRDPDALVDLDHRVVTLELLSTGETDLDAVRAGLGAIRTAIHAAGGMTAGWEEDFGDLAALPLFDADGPTTKWQKGPATFESVLLEV